MGNGHCHLLSHCLSQRQTAFHKENKGSEQTQVKRTAATLLYWQQTYCRIVDMFFLHLLAGLSLELAALSAAHTIAAGLALW